MTIVMFFKIPQIRLKWKENEAPLNLFFNNLQVLNYDLSVKLGLPQKSHFAKD
ncbi:MAG: hypothetical protein LAT76_12905 [Schleiferiaceae bacterium]|jgi:hypothetical protein|nr:hypothetical protein [Schleiferiaceae bacterium]